MRIENGEIRIGGKVIGRCADIELTPIDSQVSLSGHEIVEWRSKKVVFERTFAYPVTPPHVYNVVLQYWYFHKGCIVYV